jgi:hypothetical protein
MKQTAVEWLLDYFSKYVDMNKHIEEIEKAKEMEKQQIIDAFLKYRDSKFINKHNLNWEKSAEQYYNEQFKNK